MQKTIEVYDLNNAGRLLSDIQYAQIYTHVVSIGDPGSELPTGIADHSRKVLRQEYEDVNEYVYKYMADLVEVDFQLGPRKEHVEQIIQFLQEFLQDDHSRSLLVHCLAGISRSTAVAMIGLYLQTKDENLAGQKLQQIRPQAIPNSLIIKYADEILGCQLQPIAEQIAENRIKNLLHFVEEKAKEEQD